MGDGATYAAKLAPLTCGVGMELYDRIGVKIASSDNPDTEPEFFRRQVLDRGGDYYIRVFFSDTPAPSGIKETLYLLMLSAGDDWDW